MAKITLSTVGSLVDVTSAQSAINSNFSNIQTGLDNTISRDGSSPNQMQSNLDMNSFPIINLPAADSSTQPVRKAEFDLIANGYTGNNILIGTNNEISVSSGLGTTTFSLPSTVNFTGKTVLGLPSDSSKAPKISMYVTDYGAVADGVTLSTTINISSGSQALTVVGASFVSGDVGKIITVTGIGATGATLKTTIVAVTDATHVTIADLAATTVNFEVQTVTYGTDNTTAIAAAVTAWQANSSNPSLIFSSGKYCFTTFPNVAKNFGRIVSDGEVRLTCMNVSGTAVNINGGDYPAGGKIKMEFGPFIIEADKGVTVGLQVQSVHHSKIIATIRGCNSTSGIGVWTKWCVCTEFGLSVSQNQPSGWYSITAPQYGIVLDARNPGENTAFCYFPNNIYEGVNIGMYFLKATGNIFLGGTSEGCTSTGAIFESTSNENRIIGMDFEANTGNDISMAGVGNTLQEVYSQTAVTVSGQRCNIVGGTFSAISVSGGSINTRIQNTTFNQFVDGSLIIDNGTSSFVHGNLNAGTGVFGS